MSLLDLPAELLAMIAEALQNPRDINTLAQTSRALYSYTNYILYKSDVQNGNEKALMWAAQHNKPATAKKSLQAGVKTLKQWHWRPLLSALNNGHEAIIRLLLDEGVDPDETLFEGSWMETTALNIAVNNGHDAIVWLLIEKGASVNLKTAAGHPLVNAVSNNRKTAVGLLLEKGADPNARDRGNSTALHIAVRNRNTDIVRMLLNKGAHTKLNDYSGNTPLQIAITRSHFEIIQLLAERGADVESQDPWGRTALDLAMEYSSLQSLSLFLKQVTDLNALNFEPLHTAISKDEIAKVRLLLDHGVDVNRKDSKGRTPLLCAMLRKRESIVKVLLNYDVDPDAESDDGLTPLKLANRKNREDWARKLRRKRNGRKSSRYNLRSTSS
ncbi:hypothetical protein CNMCM5793_004185 [Aspergillus hiratsukae]|uniref:Ankyrin repeat protein n=1 Tax=Aspergillus hiratsukae TaxID=1194566 RepID=A0A8H6PRS2_9EURO|nr:hypothetical protein CNMCM5793_004185 [Aspergillus hiratsukae]KAF7159144.1 hypothetical protein CNMCM6106_006229 [Aspergillus hiratsukae]